MQFSLSRLGAIAALCVWVTSASAAGLLPITQVFLFGDSLSDTGNALSATGGAYPPDPPYFQGRLSNGMVWVEPFGTDLGVSVTNYAVAGAQTDTDNVNSDDYPDLTGTGLQTQVGQFANDLGGGAPDAGALYVVFAGSNNFCVGCFTPGVDDPVAFVNEGVTQILTAVGTLQALGAQKLLVFGLPDLGLTPRAAAIPIPGIPELLSELAAGWNDALFSNLPPQAAVVDSAAFLQDVVENPQDFGFTNVTDPCLAITACADGTMDQDEFLFWDDIHPTRAGHAILADIALQTVIPVPPAIWLFGSALGLLSWVRRRTAA